MSDTFTVPNDPAHDTVNYSAGAGGYDIAPVINSTPRSQMTTGLWATLLLLQLNQDGHSVPITPNNVNNVMTWMASEEPASSWLDRNNPLNASVGSGTSDGTGAQPSIQAGIENTAGMISQDNMAGILGALESNASPQSFKSAVVMSPWAASHYGGGSSFASSPLVAWATGTGGNPTGETGQILSSIPGESAVAGAISWTQSLGTILGKLDSVSFWERIGIFVLGATIFGVSLTIFLSGTKAGQKVESEAKSAGALAAVAA